MKSISTGQLVSTLCIVAIVIAAYLVEGPQSAMITLAETVPVIGLHIKSDKNRFAACTAGIGVWVVSSSNVYGNIRATVIAVMITVIIMSVSLLKSKSIFKPLGNTMQTFIATVMIIVAVMQRQYYSNNGEAVAVISSAVVVMAQIAYIIEILNIRTAWIPIMVGSVCGIYASLVLIPQGYNMYIELAVCITIAVIDMVYIVKAKVMKSMITKR